MNTYITNIMDDLHDNVNKEIIEINKLKKKIKQYKKPKVFYSSYQEWCTKKQDTCNIIRKCINSWVITDHFEYEHMLYQGLTVRQKMNISDCIEDALILLTNNTKWSKKITGEIMRGIEGFIHGFIECNLWTTVYAQLNPEKMAILIYKNIEWQLDDRYQLDSIWSDIAIFK